MPKYSNFYISLPNNGNSMAFTEMIRPREPFMRHLVPLLLLLLLLISVGPGNRAQSCLECTD
jgi:hypothetical protein